MSLARIQQIIRYIEEHYNEDLSIERLEQLSNYSYRNAQRIFKGIFNESIGAFQKRLKLENAYKKLIYTDESISTIAYAVGFDSLQSFSKSFKKQFAHSPSDARDEKTSIFQEFIAGLAVEHQSLHHDIVFLRAQQVFSIGIHTDQYRNREIDQLWADIDTLVAADFSADYYGVIVDQPLITDRLKCRYEACVDQDPASPLFFPRYIMGGRYLRYIHKGDYQGIMDTYRRIYKESLLQGAYAFDNDPILEHYVKNETNTAHVNDYVTEILIPLQKK